MLNPKKKIVKKEMKQDPLLSMYDGATQYYYENKKYFSYGFTALIILVIAGVMYFNNRRANNERATVELSKVFSIYDAGASDIQQYKVAISGQPEHGVMGLKSIVDNYGGTQSGEIARLYLANAYYALGQ